MCAGGASAPGREAEGPRRGSREGPQSRGIPARRENEPKHRSTFVSGGHPHAGAACNQTPGALGHGIMRTRAKTASTWEHPRNEEGASVARLRVVPLGAIHQGGAKVMDPACGCCIAGASPGERASCPRRIRTERQTLGKRPSPRCATEHPRRHGISDFDRPLFHQNRRIRSSAKKASPPHAPLARRIIQGWRGVQPGSHERVGVATIPPGKKRNLPHGAMPHTDHPPWVATSVLSARWQVVARSSAARGREETSIVRATTWPTAHPPVRGGASRNAQSVAFPRRIHDQGESTTARGNGEASAGASAGAEDGWEASREDRAANIHTPEEGKPDGA